MWVLLAVVCSWLLEKTGGFFASLFTTGSNQQRVGDSCMPNCGKLAL